MDLYNKLSDVQLAELLRSGNHAAFTEIYDRHWAGLFRHARRMLKDEAHARDLVQDLFTSIWINSERFQIRSSLSAYLYSGLRNRIIKLIYHEKVKAGYLSTLPDFEREGRNLTDEKIRENELQQLIDAEIALLPPKMRAVFELSRKAHLSYREIADQIDISEGTVKKQVYNALKILRLKFGAAFFLVLMQVIMLAGKDN